MFLAGVCSACLAAGTTQVTPGKVVTFKDWSVGCDNGLACQAVALMPGDLPGGTLSVVLNRREGAKTTPVIEITGAASKSDRYRILIDGRVAGSGTIKVGSETLQLSGANAIRVARAMAKGKSMRLVDGTGAQMGFASLAGASAAFRHADAAQGRAGSRGAIVAVGRKPAAARKSPLPVLTVKKIKPSDMLPDASALVALSESSPCAAERFGPTQDAAYSLGTGANGAQALVLLNCGSGAYNFSSAAYVGQRDAKGKWQFAPAIFDYAPVRRTESDNLALIVNADWDPATQSLSGYSKGRGIGDCGSAENYVWDGAVFRLKHASMMDECRGSMDWIPIWRAEVKIVD